MRMKSPEEEDWERAKRLLKYLYSTKGLGLTPSMDNLENIGFYVDSSFATHDNCRGFPGAMMIIGDGEVVSFSRKQWTNT